MNVIDSTEALQTFCASARRHNFVCVDTEFIREKTFYSRLCLIQAATEEEEAIIDPLADGIDMSAFEALLADESIVKVLHASRQDLEIFYHLTGQVPHPLFDTQIAAMALGFGDSVGYQALVKGRLNRNLDKGARFTDWSRRPLSDKQLNYAMGDVTHLRDLYPGMVQELKDRGRLDWVMEEMEPLLDPELYRDNPETAWERLKLRSGKSAYLAAIKAAAAWRERKAIKRDIPRRRVLSDDALQSIAMQRPGDLDTLKKLRGVPSGFERSDSAKTLIGDIKAALDDIENYAPPRPKHKQMPPNLGPRIEMLRTLLRLRTEYEDIAPRLVASNKDIEQIAAFADKADVPALRGWRYKVFGEDALKMLAGEITLRLDGRKVVAEPRGAN